MKTENDLLVIGRCRDVTWPRACRPRRGLCHPEGAGRDDLAGRQLSETPKGSQTATRFPLEAARRILRLGSSSGSRLPLVLT
jgi:hypothetical protein